MSDDDRFISESAESSDAARDAVTALAAKKWGDGNFDVNVSHGPSANLTTGETIFYTAVAKRRSDSD